MDGELCAYSTYFKGAWDALNTNGIFVLDIFGGTDTSKDIEEVEREPEPATTYHA